METFVVAFLMYSRHFSYGLFFIGMLVEGDAVLFASSFLAHQGYFFLPLLIVVGIAGALIGDSIWFFIGTKLNEHTPLFHKWLGKLSQPFDEHLRERLLRTIFISKFTYGFHHALVARAGALGIPFRKFILDDILATLPWFVIITILGYGSSASYQFVRESLHSVQIGLVLGLLSFFIIWHLLSDKLKKKI